MVGPTLQVLPVKKLCQVSPVFCWSHLFPFFHHSTPDFLLPSTSVRHLDPHIGPGDKPVKILQPELASLI